MSNEENLNETEEKVENTPDATPEKPETTETAEKPEVAETPVSDEQPADENIVTDDADGNAANADETASDSDVKESETEKPKAPRKRAHEVKSKASGDAKKGMSKLFKLIYYPVLAVAALLLLVFSIIDGVYGYKPKAHDDAYYTAVNEHITALSASVRSSMSDDGVISAKDHIVDTLKSGGFLLKDESKAGEESEDEDVTTVTDWASSNGPKPTVTVMTSRPTARLQTAMGANGYIVGMELTNIIAAYPSEATREGEDSSAVIITARYDTRTDTTGAASNGAFVANLLQTLVEYAKQDVKFDKDLIVVFTEDLDSSYGAYAFFEYFKGFGDVVSRAEYGINLDSFGNGGTLAITDVSGTNLKYLNAVTGVTGSSFDSSLIPDTLPKAYKTAGAVAAFGDIPSVQVAVIGGLDAFGSLNDSASAVSQSIVHQQSELIKNYIDGFAVSGKTVDAARGDRALTFFSYLDMGVVAYNDIAAYVIGAIILALLGGAIAVIAVKKTFSIKKMFAALGVELLVIIGALAAMFGAYFLVTLMLTGFGVLPIHAITQLRYFNGGIFTAAMLITLAATFGFTTLFKKLFKVTSSDVVRGTAVLLGATGAIMSFAVTKYSYITSWLGLLSAAVLLITACLNGKLKEKFGFGFDRLFIYTIPVILCMPITVSGISAVTALLPLTMLPVTMMLFTAMLGTAVPYLDRTAVALDKLAKKLPPRTQRVERVVTERVEDRAKKGKFTERTVKRIEKEKVPVNYKNYFGVSVIAVIGVIAALFSGGFGVTFGKTITEPYAYADSVYNDSIVYEWVKDGSTVTQKVIVDDLMTYKYARYAVDGLKWDAVNKYYYKTVNYNAGDMIAQEPEITKSGSEYTVSTYDGSYSAVTLTIPSAGSVTKITVKPLGVSGEVSYEYEFSKVDKIVLRLPYGFGNFTMTFEGSNPSKIQYEERREIMPNSEDNALANLDEWNTMLQYYRDTDLINSLRGGIVLKREFSL